MELINTNAQGAAHARGICPHCDVASLHMMVNSPYAVNINGAQQTNILVQCQNCQGVSFIVGTRRHSSLAFTFVECFPKENPENRADKNVPDNVRADFVEALRCRGISAYKAAVVMCRRALQSSCQDLTANGGNLMGQIDDLASKGSITKSLQEMAHQIRKLGNAGAHPNDDALSDVTADDANDIIEFTIQYFEHIYIMPAKMAALAKRRAAVPAAGAA